VATVRTLAATAALFTLAGFSATPARAAAVILTGSYNNNSEDGYDTASSGDYVVPVDVGGPPSATFDNNGSDGIYGYGTTNNTSALNLAVNGGQFSNDAGDDLDMYYSTTSVTGGAFSSTYATGTAIYDTYGSLNVSGGTFTNYRGVWAAPSSQVTITGGTFDDTVAFYVNHGTTSFDVYGQFTGLTPGQTESLTVSAFPQTFTGTLEFDTASQTFTYDGNTTGGAATITLHDIVGVPEPASISVIAGLSLLALRRRRGVGV
jgi:hypothetical protein